MKIKHSLLLSLITFSFTLSFAQIGFEEHIVIDETYATLDISSNHLADLDGDGDNDALVASRSDDKIAWYENVDGLGNFGPQQIISTNANIASSVYTADLDGDGDLDVLSASSDDDKIAWHENLDGLGDFGGEQIITTNADGARSVFTTDIDGDGDLDVLSASSNDDKIAWYQNLDGNGNFGEEQIISANAMSAQSVFASDLDGDGDADVLSISTADNTTAWYENLDGLGTFSSQQNINTSSIGLNSIYTSDIDGDGDEDVFTTDRDVIAWYENIDGSGSFAAAQIIVTTIDLVENAEGLITEDVDNDGDLDVVYTTTYALAWQENINGLGDFGPQQIIYSNGGIDFFTGDIDGDSDFDILYEKGTLLTWHENTTGNGEFSEANTISLIHSRFLRFSYSVDIDQDGDADILAASWDDKVVWYENFDGLGNFSAIKIISTIADAARYVHANDIDGDGDIDVLSASEADSKLAWYPNDGQGGFGAQQVISTSLEDPWSLFSADLDSDGDIDILSASYENDIVAWFENLDGQGSFSAQQIISNEAVNCVSVYSSDINGDGYQDVLYTVSGDDDKVAWHLNDGQGGFGSMQVISTEVDSPSFVYADDIDGDGDMDVLSASRLANKISWYQNLDGFGTFGAQQVVSLNTELANAIITADLDQDGDLDILSASIEDDKIAWYRNIDGAGTFGAQQLISTNADGAYSVFAIDINGDGNTDVVSSSRYDDKIAWYENIGINSNEINGLVLHDIDNNDCSILDPTVPNVMITTTDGSESFSMLSLPNGLYQLFPNEGDFTTTISVPDYYSATPASFSSSFTGIGNVDDFNFCLEPDQIANDLSIVLLPTSEARPGFDAMYQIVYHNKGTTVLSGSIDLEFNDSKLNFIEASEPETTPSNNILSFEYIDLNPFETRVINVLFTVQLPPEANIDDVLAFNAFVYPVVGDNTENDNIFELNQTLIGSFDPNDIRVLEGDEILLEDIDNYLHYIIRFQNTGTADAINVSVNNMLNANLDWTTFSFESASHDHRIEIQNGNEVNFIFDNIHLPDSSTNEPLSHGFIAYKIKPNASLSLGSVIPNQADIFFDFNEAIQTNTAMTTIVAIISVEENSLQPWSIYPIPTTGHLFVSSKFKIDEIMIYNQMGQLLAINTNENSIDISHLSNGLYFCIVKDINGRTVVEKVVKE